MLSDVNVSLDDVIFKCYVCDFKAKKENGLYVHRGLKHKEILQTSGRLSNP